MRHSRPWEILVDAKRFAVVFISSLFLWSAGARGQAPTVFNDDFEHGDLCAWSSAPPSTVCPPIFAGLTLLAATGEDELTLAWLPAESATPPEDIQYRVHLSEVPGFEPTAETLVATVGGETDLVLTGLAPATTYYVLVLAEESSGLASVERDHREITTPAFPTLLNATTPLEHATELGLGVPATVEPTRLVFDKGSTSTAPSVGAVLVGPLGDGGGYLRQVVSVTETMTQGNAEQWDVTTASGSMGDAVDQIDVRSSAVLLDVGSAAAGSASLGRAASRVHTKQADGSLRSLVTWGDTLLSIERIEHAHDHDELTVRPATDPDGRQIRHSFIELGSDVTVDLELSFEPEIATTATWGLFGVDEAELVARGTLALRATAQFDFDFAGSYAPEPVPIFTTHWRSLYVAPGGIPVYQEVTLSVDAAVSASATTSIHARAEAEASATVGAGVSYDMTNGWQPVSQLELDRSLSTTLSIQGSAEAEIRLIPEIKVEFYGVLAGRLSVEPHLDAFFAAQEAFDPLCLPGEMTRFDFDLGLECRARIDFSPFRETYPLWEGQVCAASWPLFGLTAFDEPAVTTRGDTPVEITAHLQDGVANPVDLGSILWDASPSTATLTPDEDDPRVARLCCDTSGTYNVTVGGNGRLGRWGRRCEKIAVSCTAGSCDSTPVEPAVATQIIDSSGDGEGNSFLRPSGADVDSSGNVFFGGFGTDNVFKIAPSGDIVEIIDDTGDGQNDLDSPWEIDVDGSGNVYVTGYSSDNAFKITPAGAITEIIDSQGDHGGNILDRARGIAVEPAGVVYVAGQLSDNVFKITPAGSITEIIDDTGDGVTPHRDPTDVAIGPSGNVYVTSCSPSAVFKITPGGTITRILDTSGDGTGNNNFFCSWSLTVDASENVYVAGTTSSNAFKITPAGEVTEIIDTNGDGAGIELRNPVDIRTWGGNVYLTGGSTTNVLRITPDGSIHEILTIDGDGAGNTFMGPQGLAVDGSGNVYVVGQNTNNGFEIRLDGLP